MRHCEFLFVNILQNYHQHTHTRMRRDLCAYHQSFQKFITRHTDYNNGSDLPSEFLFTYLFFKRNKKPVLLFFACCTLPYVYFMFVSILICWIFFLLRLASFIKKFCVCLKHFFLCFYFVGICFVIPFIRISVCLFVHLYFIKFSLFFRFLSHFDA